MNTQERITSIQEELKNGSINHVQAIASLNTMLVLGMHLSSAIEVSNAMQVISEGRTVALKVKRISGNVEMYHRMVNSGTAPITQAKGASL